VHERQLRTFLEKEHVVTTLSKARRLQSVVEKIVIIDSQSPHRGRRFAAKVTSDEDLVRAFIEKVKLHRAQEGGYTKIVRYGPRRGASELAILQFADASDLALEATSTSYAAGPMEPRMPPEEVPYHPPKRRKTPDRTYKTPPPAPSRSNKK
jgi:ribosomal protein L17